MAGLSCSLGAVMADMVRPASDIATVVNTSVIHPAGSPNGVRHVLSSNDIAFCSGLVGMSVCDMHCGYTCGPHEDHVVDIGSLLQVTGLWRIVTVIRRSSTPGF